ncbi:hypothetical protein D9M68_964730 [compost metagenome]
MGIGVVEGEHHVVGVEIFAVAPLGVRAQVIGHALEIVGDIKRRGQARHVLIGMPDIVDPQRLVGEIAHALLRAGRVIRVVILDHRVGVIRQQPQHHFFLRHGSRGEQDAGQNSQ